MAAAIAVFAFYFLLAFLHAPRAGGGWSWDFANALGLAAYCGLLVLMFGVRGANARKLHEIIGYAALALVFAHGLWLILSEPVLTNYFRLSAPLYMWSGVIALLAVIYLVVFSRRADRKLVHKDYESFRRWHLYISYLALAAGGYHILASGLYFSTRLEVGAAIAGVAALIVFRKKIRADLSRPPNLAAFAGVTLLSAIVFLLVRNVV
ncbi:MAG: hypothetical protein KDA48_16830 [Amphiplicatus sp.]|nr:hypothetical protein [Amphiplicatus sp.]